MTDPAARSPRASFENRHRQRRQSQLSNPDTSLLTRTRSNEIAVGESLAVHDPAHDEFQKGTEDDGEASSTTPPKTWPRSAKYLILLCCFICSLSFGITQVSILYAFRLMACDVYYQIRPDGSPSSLADPSSRHFFDANIPEGGDRCAVRSIETTTALNVSVMGASTTLFGVINLFWTGVLIKRIGLKYTLLFNVGVPAIRLLVQNIGVEVWGNIGIIIMQASQVLTVMGGPSGYILVLNSYMTEVVVYEQRTAALGQVAGSMMFGSALGYLVGGWVADAFSIKAPFRMALVAFVCAVAFVSAFLPYISPPEPKTEDESSNTKPKVGPFKRFFGPLLVFKPKKFISKDGIVRNEIGLFLLACGVFLSVLATGYLANLLQLYSTDAFSFGTSENGTLIFIYSMLRGMFLTFIFPRLIATGRRLTAKRKPQPNDPKISEQAGPSERDPLISPRPCGEDAPADGQKSSEEERFVFDLFYTRFSILLDGLLTLVCTFATKGWHMYIVATVLPFSAGTGSAAKGTVLQMVGSAASSSERVDALAGLSLVENIARLSTTFVFGVIFAAFAAIGKTGLTFTVNAAVAILGFIVLVFARFPPEDSRRLDQEEARTDEN